MNTKTRNILQGLFFLVLSLFCLFAHISGSSNTVKNFTFVGIFFCLFIGILFLKNGLKK